MAKRTYNHVALEDFEIKAQEFISLAFELCERELREHRRNQAEAGKALQFSMLSVLNSIKAFRAIVQIKPE
ncbi:MULTISPECIES: hypothetical protein [unclassified Desulfovibrio]|uniref:hypothetical protein n=1 Tax=unclassified Desulfovibrio TaxID=2593640 RepID=UPI002FDB37AB